MKSLLYITVMLIFSGHQAFAGTSDHLNLRGVVPIKHEVNLSSKTLSSNQSTVVRIETKTKETRILLLANKDSRSFEALSEEGARITFEAL